MTTSNEDINYTLLSLNLEFKRLGSPVEYRVQRRNGYWNIDDIEHNGVHTGLTKKECYFRLRTALLALQAVPSN